MKAKAKDLVIMLKINDKLHQVVTTPEQKEVILALFETMPILKKPFCDLETEEGIDANIDILQEKSIKTV